MKRGMMTSALVGAALVACAEWKPAAAPFVYGQDAATGYFAMRTVPSDHKAASRCEAADVIDRHEYRGPAIVEIEMNGYLTYDRKVSKFDTQVLRAAHEKVYEAARRHATKKADQ